MANNYVSLAESINMPLPAALYLVGVVQLADLISEGDEISAQTEISADAFVDGVPGGPIPVTEAMIEDANALAEQIEEWGEIGCKIEIEQGDKLYIGTEESINVDALAPLLQSVMKQFNLATPIALQWANSCSRPIAGNFGGGACVITQNDIEWFDSGRWANSKIQEMTGLLTPLDRNLIAACNALAAEINKNPVDTALRRAWEANVAILTGRHGTEWMTSHVVCPE